MDSTLTPESKEFLAKEYDTLRKEIESNRDASDKLIQFGLPLLGGLWAYILKEGHQPLLLMIPILLTAAFLHRSYAISLANKRIGRYIVRIEGAFQLPDGLGWENQIRTVGSPLRADEIRGSTVVFWWVALGVQIVGCWIVKYS